jgi:two-component system, NarL family, invasion response regulator UvrY
METVLIADDHEIVRRGVRMIIENFPGKYQFIEASTCAEVATVLSSGPVDYAIIDMMMTDGNILSVSQQIQACSHHTKTLVYSMNAERIYARRLMEKGARGFLCKQNSIEELEKAIHTVFRGDVYLSEELTDILLNTSQANLRKNPIDLLSDRELEVVEYYAIGMGTKEIAQKMNLDMTTISTFRRRAFEKMEVQNAIELKEKFLLYKSQAG